MGFVIKKQKMITFVKNLLTMFITMPFIYGYIFQSLLTRNSSKFSSNFIKKFKKQCLKL